MSRRELSIEDIESLAVGAWVLGTGGGGNPYLPLLNMRALYGEGHRVQLMPAADLADDDLVAGAGGMGAPLVGIERMGDPYTLTRAVLAMEAHIKRRFTALMSVEIGGGNGVRPLMAAALMKLPVVDSDRIAATYADAFALMRDLRAMGETNAQRERRKAPTRRGTLARAASLYRERAATAGGRVVATFQTINLTAWAPAN